MHPRLRHAALLLLILPVAAVFGARAAGQAGNAVAAAQLENPVAPTQDALAAGKRAYDTNCAACHGNMGQGAVKAGIAISIIAEQGGKQPPDLTDGQTDHGSTDGEIYTVV